MQKFYSNHNSYGLPVLFLDVLPNEEGRTVGLICCVVWSVNYLPPIQNWVVSSRFEVQRNLGFVVAYCPKVTCFTTQSGKDGFFHFRTNFFVYFLYKINSIIFLTCEWYSSYLCWWEALAPARKSSLFVECFSVSFLIPFLYFIIRKIHLFS